MEDAKIEYFDDGEQADLDNLITDYIIGRCTTEDYQFDDLFEQEWIESEGVLRLCQSFINQFNDDRVNSEKFKLLFNKFFVNSANSSCKLPCKLLELIDDFINPQIELFELNWIKHRNVCWVLEIVLEKCSNSIGSEISSQVFNYLLRLMNESELLKTVLWSIITLERLLLSQEQIKSHNVSAQLVSSFLELSFYYDQCNTTTNIYQIDLIQYQVGFCAQWCLNQLQANCPKPFQQSVKLLSDRMCARNDSYQIPTVKSAFKVTSGVYFYEVVLLTDGPTRIGWTGPEGKFGLNKQLGDDDRSIGLDVYHRCLWHDRKRHQVDRNCAAKPGNVVGCLVDVAKSSLSFYLNGRMVDYNIDILLPISAFIAAVSLGTHQQCYFNFGQLPFKHPPPNGVKIQTFHYASKGDEFGYNLLETNLIDQTYWFKGRIIEPICPDEAQSEFDEMVAILKIDPKRNLPFEKLAQQPNSCVRMIQSIIKMLNDDNVSSVLFNASVQSFFKSTDQSSFSHLDFLEMICPYMNNRKHNRKVCIILSIMARNWLQSKLNDNFLNEINTFLMDVILSSEDSFNVLFALITLETVLWTNQQMADQLLKNECLLDKIALLEDCSNDFDLIKLQVSFCVDWIRKNALQTKPTNEYPIIKLSTDKLSARCDTEMHPSIRSAFAVKCGIYLYEVTLATDGQMQFGWSTRGCQFGEKTFLGSDKNSIAFDGHEGVILHDGTKYELDSANALWKVGDLVGCLIDTYNKQFVFYLNGVQLNHQELVFFSSEPYFATASISLHQQCHFNFGQEAFKCVPPNIEFPNFHKVCHGDLSQYQLIEPLPMKDFTATTWFWFDTQDLTTDSFTSHQGNIFYRDCDQQLFNDLIMEIEQKVATGELSLDHYYLTLQDQFKDAIESENGLVRLIQSMIEVMGTELSDTNVNSSYLWKIDVLVGWVESLLQRHIADLSVDYNFLELIHLYMRIVSVEDSKYVVQKRNICIVLSVIAQRFRNLFTDNITCFLSAILRENVDFWTLIFAIISLERYAEDGDNLLAILKCEQIIPKLEELARHCEMVNLSALPCDSLSFEMYPVAFCARWALDNTLKVTKQFQALDSPTHTNQTINLKVSPNGQSVRSDWGWKNIRFVDFPVLSSHYYYYETILMTNGPMQIGWTTLESDLNRCQIGGDGPSVGFDGYHRCIWHANKQYPVEMSSVWRAGFVVGCLIDVHQSKFEFFLNGNKLEPQDDIHFSSQQTYYPAASFFFHQQAHFNFGKNDFLHLPKKVDSLVKRPDLVKDIQVEACESSNCDLPTATASNEQLIDICNLCKKRPYTLKFTSCDHWKLCLHCANILTTCPVCV